MSILPFDRLLEFLGSIQWVMAVLWLGLVFFTVGLAILLYTRWGQYQPLRKCMAMSLLAHLLLAGYAATLEIVGPGPRPVEETLYLSLGDGPYEDAAPGGAGPASSEATDQPWETFPGQPVAAEPAELEHAFQEDDADQPGNPPLTPVALADAKPLEPEAAPNVDAAEQSLPGEASRPIETADIPAALLPPIQTLPRMTEAELPEQPDPFIGPANPVRPQPVDDEPADRDSRFTVASITGSTREPTDRDNQTAELVSSRIENRDSPEAIIGRGGYGRQSVPDAYRLRVAPNRAGIAQSHGGTAETEAAVRAALKWLADNQAADGRWNPRVHNAGQDSSVLGRTRQAAGSRADTGMTGLALLSFLGSGHTHLDGPYRHDVRRGLEYLMRTQAPDGNLGGHAAAFEFMYCHAMATCALSEAYGMTRDERLRDSVRRAIGYTVSAQDPNGGGWRYRLGNPGDTSQLGWQLMALKSADLAGISMPEATRQGIIRYLRSVSSGRYGGRASYRPGERPTRPMTAEALVCWQFLGLRREHPACREASEYLADELPGEGAYNLYYWYYATLGTYQLQGPHWQRWNEGLRAALVNRQIKEGPLAGSWDINSVWGGHGGRVYTTAMAALTLEVYYRFLPLYAGVLQDVDSAE